MDHVMKGSPLCYTKHAPNQSTNTVFAAVQLPVFLMHKITLGTHVTGKTWHRVLETTQKKSAGTSRSTPQFHVKNGMIDEKVQFIGMDDALHVWHVYQCFMGFAYQKWWLFKTIWKCRTTGPPWPREVAFFPLDGDIQRSRRGSTGPEEKKRMSLQCSACIRLYQSQNLKCLTTGCALLVSSAHSFVWNHFANKLHDTLSKPPMEETRAKNKMGPLSCGSRLSNLNHHFFPNRIKPPVAYTDFPTIIKNFVNI